MAGKDKPLSIAQTWIPKGIKMSYKNFAACFMEVTTLIKVNTALIRGLCKGTENAFFSVSHDTH